jgi:hypothetical protein
MALDNTCSDFFSLLDLTSKGQTTRPAIEWLHRDTKRFLALYPDRYTRRTANIDCALRRHSRRLGSPRHAGHLSTIAAVGASVNRRGIRTPFSG